MGNQHCKLLARASATGVDKGWNRYLVVNAPPSISASTTSACATLLAGRHAVADSLSLFLCLEVWTFDHCTTGCSSYHKSKQIHLPSAFRVSVITGRQENQTFCLPPIPRLRGFLSEGLRAPQHPCLSPCGTRTWQECQSAVLRQARAWHPEQHTARSKGHFKRR